MIITSNRIKCRDKNDLFPVASYLIKTSSQKSTIQWLEFGNSDGDFISDINALNANDKTGIQNSMIHLILSLKLVNTLLSLDKYFFTTINYSEVKIW